MRRLLGMAPLASLRYSGPVPMWWSKITQNRRRRRVFLVRNALWLDGSDYTSLGVPQEGDPHPDNDNVTVHTVSARTTDAEGEPWEVTVEYAASRGNNIRATRVTIRDTYPGALRYMCVACCNLVERKGIPVHDIDAPVKPKVKPCPRPGGIFTAARFAGLRRWCAPAASTPDRQCPDRV